MPELPVRRVEVSPERARVKHEVEESLEGIEEALGLLTMSLVALEDTMSEIQRPTDEQDQKYHETRAALLRRIDWLDGARADQEQALHDVASAA
jgi:hypothetical protein